MRTIYRYEINDSTGINNVEMPENAKVLSCGISDDIISIWAEVESSNNLETRSFCVVGTGANIDELYENYYPVYIGTVKKSNRYAFHIYETPFYNKY